MARIVPNYSAFGKQESYVQSEQPISILPARTLANRGSPANGLTQTNGLRSAYLFTRKTLFGRL